MIYGNDRIPLNRVDNRQQRGLCVCVRVSGRRDADKAVKERKSFRRVNEEKTGTKRGGRSSCGLGASGAYCVGRGGNNAATGTETLL